MCVSVNIYIICNALNFITKQMLQLRYGVTWIRDFVSSDSWVVENFKIVSAHRRLVAEEVNVSGELVFNVS